ncbi:hypothetical protein [Absidia glauca]|uniref:MULE transposase domain-containing protein n=1 Tax=Absidia glauca TaxID=4829 RepID=A0A168M237_ABSGL|nr:hypothetical protein [Absidia glauca]
MPDVLVMDATYSTNTHGMPFINIVGVNYEWFLYRLKDTIFAPGSLLGPTLMVTDKAQSLINAIKTVFPGTVTMLCTVHNTRNFSTNVKPTFRNSKKYEEIEEVRKKMYYCQTEAEYNAASKSMPVLLKMEKSGMKWIGYHTNELPHFGCNTTNRVEGSQAVLKRLIKTSNGRLDKVFDEVDIWCRKIAVEVYQRLPKRISEDTIEKRYVWAMKWANSDMNYTRNCGFIDEAGFNVNLRRSMDRVQQSS